MSQPTPDNLRAALLALQRCTHAYIGLRVLGAVPSGSPCILLADNTLNALLYALDTAAEQWPGATAWEIVASDQTLKEQPQNMPPSAIILRTPVIVATLTADPASPQPA